LSSAWASAGPRDSLGGGKWVVSDEPQAFLRGIERQHPLDLVLFDPGGGGPQVLPRVEIRALDLRVVATPTGSSRLGPLVQVPEGAKRFALLVGERFWLRRAERQPVGVAQALQPVFELFPLGPVRGVP